MKRLLFAALAFSTLASAQSISLLGVYPYGETGQLKAQVDLQGHTIAHVKTLTYQLPGGTVSCIENHYETFDAQFISADVPTPPGDNAFQMEVTLDNGTVLRSECINVTNTTRFRWLGDYTPTTTQAGGAPLSVDCCASDHSLPLTTGKGVVYHKGISAKGGKYTYVFPESERVYDFKALMGVQQNGGGNLQMRIKLNGKGQMGFTQSNGNVPFDFYATDPRWAAYYDYPITTMLLDFTHNPNAVGNYFLARVYFEGNDTRQAQTIETSMQSGTITYPRTVDLQATATSGGRIYYRLIKGHDLVTLDDGRITFLDNKTGEVIVEATQYGNSQYSCAVKILKFEMQTGEQMFPTSHLDANSLSPATDFLYINRSLRRFNLLQVQIYDGIHTLRPVGEPIDILQEFRNRVGSGNDAVVPFYGVGYGYIYRIIYRFEGDADVKYSPYVCGTEMFDFLSDLPHTPRTGWGTVGIDKSVEQGTLNIAGTTYAKGFGIHATGWVRTEFSLAPYSRMETVVGKQNGKAGKMEITLNANAATIPLLTTAVFAGSVAFPWYVPITPDMQSLTINIGQGGDGNGSDHGVIGSPRFYYLPKQRREQVLTWKDEHRIVEPDAFTLPLDEAHVGISTTSGLPIHFRITRGSEYATIENGNVLNVHHVPAAGVIEVEAFQPGNREWRPSQSATCRFALTDGIEVQKHERITVDGGTDIDQLIIHADAQQCGQVEVKSGAVSIKRLVLKYTFVPKEWNFIAFPTDVNIDKISNLNALGYDYNVRNSGRGTYYISRYSTELRTLQPSGSAWEALPTPDVKGQEGYIMGVNNALGMDPVEVTFTIENTTLNPDTKLHAVGMTLDLTDQEPGSRHDVYIRPANVKGNTLRVSVDYQPNDQSLLPINHQKALEAMRITNTHDGQGIRLTLPDQTPAHVAIYNKKGTKLVKAVRYVAPHVIDLSDLKRGTYQMVVHYGKATVTRAISK